jgi:hypothetical protein
VAGRKERSQTAVEPAHRVKPDALESLPLQLNAPFHEGVPPGNHEILLRASWESQEAVEVNRRFVVRCEKSWFSRNTGPAAHSASPRGPSPVTVVD